MIKPNNINWIVTTFLSSLETYPKAVELINIIEKLISDKFLTVNSKYIASLMELSNNNVTLLVNLWFICGVILEEEGKNQEAIRTFLEAIHWNSKDISTCLRIADFFISKNELIKATYFFSKAQEQFNLNYNVTDKFFEIIKLLERNLIISPGFVSSEFLFSKNPFNSRKP